MFPIQTEIAWAAGFFDGEGCICVNGMEYRVSVNQTDPRPLDRFVAAVGGGKVRGPYSRGNPKHRDYWMVTYSSKGACQVLKVLWPYMSAPKREQACTQWDKKLGRERLFRKRQEATRGPKGHLVSLALADLEMCNT